MEFSCIGDYSKADRGSTIFSTNLKKNQEKPGVTTVAPASGMNNG